MDFSKTLLNWYLQHGRDLPWRRTHDPYLIWLSEIMLQQTRVAQGLPYYLAFAEAFPTVHDLAGASEEAVLKRWQGLGYYSRGRNLHKTARIVAFELEGKFPESHSGLLTLKGVGDYTAAAIASFAFGEKVPAVDGNVFRVLARFFDIDADIALPQTRKIFRDLALSLMPDDAPAQFNQAIMEFGALQCVPRNPDCRLCVLKDACLALKRSKVGQLPVKLKKTKVTERFFQYVVPVDERGKTLVHKREGKGIWRNLYEFPLIETTTAVEAAELTRLIAQSGWFPETNEVQLFLTETVSHKLTHQLLRICFWRVAVWGTLQDGLEAEALHKLPFPIVVHKFILSHFPR